MWFLNTKTYSLEERFGHEVSKYAILSHTWQEEEVLFQEMREGGDGYQRKAGYRKIKACCDLAATRGIPYAWVDTCCIDKRHSADLLEAINSMYNYYRNATECYIYLADVPGDLGGSSHCRSRQLSAVKSSRWFTRGWTLQELIASSARAFYAQDWSPIPVDIELMTLIAKVTGIELDLLQNRELLSKYCIATRMSWASARTTTRPEDMAYCLMGIFNVSMPVLYGEGLKKAFQRLQAEIISTSFDQTIYTWRGPYESSGLLANSPLDFANTPSLGLWAPANLAPFTMTNVGFHARLLFYEQPHGKAESVYHRLAGLQCDILSDNGIWRAAFVRLKLLPGVHCFLNGKKCDAYRRVACEELVVLSRDILDDCEWEDILVLQDEHYNLVNRSIEEHNNRWGTQHTVETPQKYLGQEDA
ncbi:HET-domain-containing protein [Xylariaceae sp. AK1471]|nr:HET-domain-containing protein [Xylariaceae sp. AK1471]